MTPVLQDTDVVVYAFQVYSVQDEGFRTATFKATREAIVGRFGGQVLESTAETVDVTDLDAQGRFRRIATGWGALD